MYIEKGDSLNDLEAEGMIQCFEYTYEMAWLTMKDFHDPDMDFEIQGARDAFMFATRFKTIDDSNCWEDMLRDRNRSVHSYNYARITKIADNIRTRHYPAMVKFKQRMDQHRILQQTEINY